MGAGRIPHGADSIWMLTLLGVHKGFLYFDVGLEYTVTISLGALSCIQPRATSRCNVEVQTPPRSTRNTMPWDTFPSTTKGGGDLVQAVGHKSELPKPELELPVW